MHLLEPNTGNTAHFTKWLNPWSSALKNFKEFKRVPKQFFSSSAQSLKPLIPTALEEEGASLHKRFLWDSVACMMWNILHNMQYA